MCSILCCSLCYYRGSANEWFEALSPYLHYSTSIRRWFCQKIFLNHRNRFCEFILESPSAEVSNVFFIVHVFKCSISDSLSKPIAIISKAQCYFINLWEANNVCACFYCKMAPCFFFSVQCS